MRTHFLALCAFILLSGTSFAAVTRPAFPEPKLCQTSRNASLYGAVGEVICDRPDIEALFKAESDFYYSVLHGLSGRSSFFDGDAPVLKVEESDWYRDLAGCIKSGTKDGVTAAELDCLREKIRARMNFLEAVKADPKLIIAHAADPDRVDPWYLRRFGPRYEGRKVYVVAEAQITSCHAKPGFADVVMGESFVIPITFEHLTRSQLLRLCEKKPYGTWYGTVKRDSAGTYFIETADTWPR